MIGRFCVMVRMFAPKSDRIFRTSESAPVRWARLKEITALRPSVSRFGAKT